MTQARYKASVIAEIAKALEDKIALQEAERQERAIDSEFSRTKYIGLPWNLRKTPKHRSRADAERWITENRSALDPNFDDYWGEWCKRKVATNNVVRLMGLSKFANDAEIRGDGWVYLDKGDVLFLREMDER